MGREFVIDYIAWRSIFGWFLSGIIFICFAFIIPFDSGLNLLFIMIGVVFLILGIWFTINYFRRDDDYNRSRPQYNEYQEPSNRGYRRQEPIRAKIPKFCPECGKPTKGRKFCSVCGERLR